jgi:hypothetical protein
MKTGTVLQSQTSWECILLCKWRAAHIVPFDIVACLLKARTVKPAGKTVTRERLCKYIVLVATKGHKTIEELLETVFSVPSLYNESVLSR